MNETEQSIFDECESQGFDVIHVGVPDFILLKDGEISFVEAKTAADPVRDSQVRAIALLRKHGFTVKIVRIPRIRHSSLLQEWRENHTKPVQPCPNHSRPIQPILAQASPSHSIPIHTNPDHARPKQTKPDHSTPIHLPQPSQTNPIQTKQPHPNPNQPSQIHKDLWRR